MRGFGRLSILRWRQKKKGVIQHEGRINRGIEPDYFA
jgi:hypothetical protein